MSKFHIDPELQKFRNLNAPFSYAAQLRQRIYAMLSKEPTRAFLFTELPDLATGDPSAIHAAARTLVRKGLAERITKIIPNPSEKKPDRVKKLSAIRLIGAWQGSKSGSWDKPEQPWDARHPLFNQ